MVGKHPTTDHASRAQPPSSAAEGPRSSTAGPEHRRVGLPGADPPHNSPDLPKLPAPIEYAKRTQRRFLLAASILQNEHADTQEANPPSRSEIPIELTCPAKNS